MADVGEWEMGYAGVVLGGRYRLGPELGRGGHSTVHRSLDTRLTRLVAVKVLLDEWCADPVAREHFAEEQRALALMDHPRIARVHDGDLEPSTGPPWVVQTLVTGRTLRRVVDDELDAGRSIEVARAAGWAVGVLDALVHIHGQGHLHGDVSPRNVLVDDHDDTVVVIDLGAGRLGCRQRAPATAAYAAPERVTGDVVAEPADIYSLGALVFATLGGRPPFDGADADAVAGLQVRALPPSLRSLRPDVPVALDGILLATLAKDPADRPDAVDLRAVLRSVCSTEPVGRPEATVRGSRDDGVTPPLVLAPAAPRAAPAVTASVPVVVPPPVADGGGGGGARGTRRDAVALVCLLALAALGLVGYQAFFSESPALPAPASAGAAPPPTARASPSSTVVVPAVVGLGRDAAAARLKAAGLVVGSTVERDAPARKGVVVAVEPAEGQALSRGTVVGLVVARGTTTVPDVVGDSLPDALAALSRSGLAVTWTRVPATEVGVLAVLPAPGAVVRQGSTVELQVGSGAPPEPAPSTPGGGAAATVPPGPDATGPPSSPTPSASSPSPVPPSDGPSPTPT